MAADVDPSIEAWRAYCQAMADAGELVLAEGAPDHANARAEGIRALSRFFVFGLENCLERADPQRPEFVDVQTTIRKYMGDNPDQTYFSSVISGDRSYRINATMAGAVAVEIGVYAGSFASGGGRRLVDAVEDTTLLVDPDGSYELLLTPDPEPDNPNQLRLEADASSVLIRTYFTDLAVRLAHPRPTIEAIPSAGPAPMLTPDQLRQGLEISVLIATGSFGWWVQQRKKVPSDVPVNTFPPLPDEGDLLTPENVRYLSGDWELAPHEALVLDFDPSGGADYWAWVLLSHWGETVDWRNRTAVINGDTAVRRDDGTVRLVVAHQDPGMPNWLDTAGHPQGSLSLRWFRSDAPLPVADARVIPFDQLPTVD
ncbi:MAG: DUF1214 domain-containing protein [Acidimicrobiia bacterium]|nr:DUF1214 domain-containing protein [Acidimicrobiia bacterium]MYB11504.1 DUF1214 domain-containing protein [Acidimicrobiia bacterium]MYG59664.1 DUF1214 domain-containing protein [Acidimicrobiia bacterium]MYG73329.1 DUF1214 domain-containing protein [Acidimicrobiia bacterium]MYJ31079.1 DUF1214 domain-containing protein [Acidimicrobiia bacterium]